MDLWAVAGAMRGGASFAEVRHAHEAGVALPAYARERTAGHEHHEVLRYRGVAVARDARSGVNTGLDVVPPAPRLSVSAVER